MPFADNGAVSQTCSACRVEKPVAEFSGYFDRTSARRRLAAKCRPCLRSYQRAKHRTYVLSPAQKNRRRLYALAYQRTAVGKQSQRWAHIKMKYGLTKPQYVALFDSQGGKCAVCFDTSERGLVVDHDHVTGLVRGLLCGYCNKVIGMAFDRREVLLAASNYLLLAKSRSFSAVS